MNRKRKLTPSITIAGKLDRIVLRAVVVLHPVAIFIALGGSTLTGQQPVTQPDSVPLPGFSILERNEPLVESKSIPATPIRAVPATAKSATADAGQSIDQLLTRLVLENIPHNFEESKDWGGQDQRWDGVKVRLDGLKLETQRRKKMVNHGTWKKYSVQLRNPDEEFTVQVKNMRETDDEKLAFDVHFLAHLNVDGRQSKWVKGVQLYSIGITGHTQVRLVVSVELEVKMGGTTFPPDLVFVPRATQAELILDEFRIDRIGKVGGEIAQQVTQGIRSQLDEKIAEKENKLLEKINRQLVEKQDQLRISIADAIKSKWTKSAQAFLPGSIQASLDQ